MASTWLQRVCVEQWPSVVQIKMQLSRGHVLHESQRTGVLMTGSYMLRAGDLSRTWCCEWSFRSETSRLQHLRTRLARSARDPHAWSHYCILHCAQF